MKLSLEVNGRPVELEIEPQETLAEVLRNRCQLTGVKISCEVQVCGSCTTLVDGQPVSACTFLAYEARNRRVTTVEGLSDGARLHPMQQAFIDEFAFQCGFCTPGMILSTHDLLSRNPDPSEDEIRHGLEGNLCRCTGYQHIVNAVQAAAKKMKR
jgi:carbon-monoxide dehydrogenase small subunit